MLTSGQESREQLIRTNPNSLLRGGSSEDGLSGHLPVLDGIRGLAILLVTAYRFDIGPEYSQLPGSLLFQALRHGDIGVDLFFVLSGFLITGILFDAKGSEHYFRNFYARRALRIFPLYYGFLFFTLVALPALCGPECNLFPEAKSNQAWLWLYGANLLVAIRDSWCLGSFDHFWSLSVEEHFYFIWPLVIFFFSRRQAMVASLIAIVFSTVGRVIWIRLGGGGATMEAFTLFRLDGLAIGAWLALAARGPSGIRPFVTWSYATAVVCGMALIGIWNSPHPRLHGIPLMVLALLFGSLLVLAMESHASNWWGMFWRSRVLKFFGKYSYAMYVFQLPLIRIMQPVLTPEGLCSELTSVFLGRLAYIGLMTTITTVLAVLSWHLYEKHFLALKRWFESGRTTA
jgi:peptidoglycan/LPS O-acetylase OafA/YrhL